MSRRGVVDDDMSTAHKQSTGTFDQGRTTTEKKQLKFLDTMIVQS
jgi:hypothetical protein